MCVAKRAFLRLRASMRLVHGITRGIYRSVLVQRQLRLANHAIRLQVRIIYAASPLLWHAWCVSPGLNLTSFLMCAKCVWRSHAARRKVAQLRHLRDTHAATTVQKAVRGHFGRQEVSVAMANNT